MATALVTDQYRAKADGRVSAITAVTTGKIHRPFKCAYVRTFFEIARRGAVRYVAGNALYRDNDDPLAFASKNANAKRLDCTIEAFLFNEPLELTILNYG